MQYIKLRRSDNICNICEKQKQLSWDHIPPKGGIDLSDMWVQSLTKSYLSEEQTKMTVSQNGLKYRTICSDCNSALARYDLAFKNLLMDVKMIVKSSLILPNPIKINTYPVRIAKCVLGHLLAAKTNDCYTVQDKQIRKYISDDNEKMPDGLRIFFWFYPYNCTIIKTDVYELNILYGGTCLYSILKSFPLAFIVFFDNSHIENANELQIDDNDNYNTQKNILFNSDAVNDWNFPEKLGNNKVHLVQKDSTNILATPKYPDIKTK